MNSEFPAAPTFEVIANDVDGTTDEIALDQARSQARAQMLQLALAWLLVGIPLAYGFYETVLRAAKLFTG